MPDKPVNHFARLKGLGYNRLVSVTPPGCPVSEKSGFHRRVQAGDDARGKAPGVKWGDGSWSGYDWIAAGEPTDDDLERWHAWGAGVGVRLGDGLVFVDCDTPNIEHARIVLAIARRRFDGFKVRVGRDPKFGFFLRATDVRYCRIEYGSANDRVEVLSGGRQVVVHGTHPITGKPYKWPDGLPHLADVLEATQQEIDDFLEECAAALPAASPIVREGAQTEVDQESLRADMALVTKAVKATPNTSDVFPTRESYTGYGYAIKAAAGPEHEVEAFDLYADWCARWTEGENDPRLVEADWKRMKGPYRRGASWLFELAEAHGAPGAFSQAERWFEQPADESIFPTEKERAPQKRFSLTPFAEAAATALSSTALPLIKGILDQGAMTVLYGESNAGKTFVAMDISYHVATGLQWAGRRVARAAVLYVAAEGGQGARKRAAALSARYGAAGEFLFLLHPVNLLRADADLGPLIATIRDSGLVFGLIVIDTLSRAMAGGDENASTDMGAMVKHLDALRAATGAHLMVVHHSGKDRAKGARGHSLLRAATDTEIEVADRVISVTKQRDLDGSFASGFELDVAVLGVDAEGDPVTSCTIRLVDRESAKVGRATKREREVLTAFEELAAVKDAADSPGVTAEEVAEWFESNDDKLSVNGARTLIKKLVTKEFLEKIGRNSWRMSEKSGPSHISYVNQSGPEVVQNIFQ